MRLQKYIKNDDANTLLEVAIFMDDEILDEGIGEWGSKIKGVLSKAGIDVHKGKGLLQILAGAGATLGKFLWYAIRASNLNDKESREKLKEIANTEIKKEQVIDFLLKLDALTLHAITGPIHMIDALTGWHIWAKVSKTSADIITRAKEAISHLESIATKIISQDIKSKIKEYIVRLKSLLGLEKAT